MEIASWLRRRVYAAVWLLVRSLKNYEGCSTCIIWEEMGKLGAGRGLGAEMTV